MYKIHSGAIGTRTSSHIYRRFGVRGLPDGQLTVRLRGSAGQSLGAFAMNGLRLIVDGDSNDYVGKGLSGGEIFVAPQGHSKINAHESTIIGNTCLLRRNVWNIIRGRSRRRAVCRS